MTRSPARRIMAVTTAGLALSAAGFSTVAGTHLTQAVATTCTPVGTPDPSSDASDATGTQQDQLDIVQFDFALDSTGTKLRTAMTIKNLSKTIPAPNNTMTYTQYWTFGGTNYATEAAVDSSGNVTYSDGTITIVNGNTNYTPKSGNGATGSFGSGANGVVEIDAPLSDIGNPSTGQTLTSTNAFTGEASGANGSSIGQTLDADTGNNYTLGQATCLSSGGGGGTPTPTPTPTPSPTSSGGGNGGGNGPAFTPQLQLATPINGVQIFVAKDAEPSIRVANDGGIYVTAPIGGPTGGCDFWTVQPGGTGSTYKGKADNSAGGGDCDIATSATTELPNNKDVIFASSLQGALVTGANITTTNSLDGGNTFGSNPASQPIPADDRMWNAAGAANNPLDFYMTFRQIPGTDDVIVEHSVDGGLTFAPVTGSPVTSTASFAGNLVVSADGQSIYVIYEDNNASRVRLAASHNAGSSWTLSTIHDGSGAGQTYGNIFPSIALDPDNSTLYAVYSDGAHIHYASAPSDAGPWAEQIVPVLDGTASNVFPWVVSRKHGIADLVWYGTPDHPETATSKWNVYFARYTSSANPVLSRVSTTPNHTGYICTSGTGCSGTPGTPGDRTMLDFFQISDGADGRAHIAWTKDNPGNPNEPTVIMYAEEVPGTTGPTIPEAPWTSLLLLSPGLAAAAFALRLRRRRNHGMNVQDEMS